MFPEIGLVAAIEPELSMTIMIDCYSLDWDYFDYDEEDWRK